MSNVNVYIIDTGVGTHSDINLAGHVNFAGGQNTDCHGHGTHVAGTAAARDNTSDVVGVAPGAPVYGVKVLGCSGRGSNSGVIAGVDWVTANAKKPAAANMSLGGGVSILSTKRNGGTTTMSGTSMASPHGAGGGALYLSSNTAASPSSVEAALPGSAASTGTASKDGRYKTAVRGRVLSGPEIDSRGRRRRIAGAVSSLVEDRAGRVAPGRRSSASFDDHLDEPGLHNLLPCFTHLAAYPPARRARS